MTPAVLPQAGNKEALACYAAAKEYLLFALIFMSQGLTRYWGPRLAADAISTYVEPNSPPLMYA